MRGVEYADASVELQAGSQVVHLEITRRDIQSGVFGAGNLCPGAIALRRLFPDREILISAGMVIAGAECTSTPPGLAAWIRRYDAREPVGPASFELLLEPARLPLCEGVALYG